MFSRAAAARRCPRSPASRSSTAVASTFDRSTSACAPLPTRYRSSADAETRRRRSRLCSSTAIRSSSSATAKNASATSAARRTTWSSCIEEADATAASANLLRAGRAPAAGNLCRAPTCSIVMKSRESEKSDVGTLTMPASISGSGSAVAWPTRCCDAWISDSICTIDGFCATARATAAVSRAFQSASSARARAAARKRINPTWYRRIVSSLFRTGSAPDRSTSRRRRGSFRGAAGAGRARARRRARMRRSRAGGRNGDRGPRRGRDQGEGRIEPDRRRLEGGCGRFRRPVDRGRAIAAAGLRSRQGERRVGPADSSRRRPRPPVRQAAPDRGRSASNPCKPGSCRSTVSHNRPAGVRIPRAPQASRVSFR